MQIGNKHHIFLRFYNHKFDRIPKVAGWVAQTIMKHKDDPVNFLELILTLLVLHPVSQENSIRLKWWGPVEKHRVLRGALKE